MRTIIHTCPMLPGETDPIDKALAEHGVTDPINHAVLKQCVITVGHNSKNWFWKITFED